jgi:hypothetical protein
MAHPRTQHKTAPSATVVPVQRDGSPSQCTQSRPGGTEREKGRGRAGWRAGGRAGARERDYTPSLNNPSKPASRSTRHSVLQFMNVALPAACNTPLICCQRPR